MNPANESPENISFVSRDNTKPSDAESFRTSPALKMVSFKNRKSLNCVNEIE
jgi:hypothetical protein